MDKLLLLLLPIVQEFLLRFTILISIKYILKSSTVIIMNNVLVGVKITSVVLFYYSRILQILSQHCTEVNTKVFSPLDFILCLFKMKNSANFIYAENKV